MIVHDKDIGVVRLLDRDDAGCTNCMPATSGCASLDCRSSYEELLADYQELKQKYQELEHELTRQRARAGSYKWCWKKASIKLEAEREERKRISCVSKDALSLEKEVQRLRALLEEVVGVDTRKRSTIVSLRMENSSLKDENIGLKNENAEMKKQVKNLLSNRKVLSNSLYGRRSEKQKRPPSGRRRGQQPGAPGHGRTARPDIEVVEESWYPSEDELTCASCGKRYVGKGSVFHRCMRLRSRRTSARLTNPVIVGHATVSHLRSM